MIAAPYVAEVREVDDPRAGPGEAVVEVVISGICGTDAELFSGEMQYLHDGHAEYPIRIGHEWSGLVKEVGEGVDTSLLGRRVTGDTMLGCQRCRRCKAGHHNVCEYRSELGVRNGRPGALADRVAVPAWSLHTLPDEVDDVAGALVEPAGNAFVSVRSVQIDAGDRLLVLGAGTIALLTAMIAQSEGAEVHLLGRSERSIAFAKTLGFSGVWQERSLPDLTWAGVIDASNAPALPAKAVDLVEPGRRVVYVGLSGSPSILDTRSLVLKDVTAVGVLGASHGLEGAIKAFASGAVDPHALVSATVSIDQMGEALGGQPPINAGPGPKVLADMRIGRDPQ